MDHDVYTLSERERALVFTALDLYREAAEKQIAGASLNARPGRSEPYTVGHHYGRHILEVRERRQSDAPAADGGDTPVTLAKDRAIQAEAEGDQELEADGPDHMREALAGDERHLSEYFDLLSPTLISILKARGIITVGHVAERWDELPTITGVGQTSIEHLEAVLEEAAVVGVGGAESDDDPLPF